jgi:simple sugar transport system substrate-binding protein
MNTELPLAEAKYAAEGTGYVGAVLHDAGFALAQEAIERGGLQSGDRAFVWGLVAQPGRGERTQGILDALEEAGLTVDYQETPTPRPAFRPSPATCRRTRTSRPSSSTTGT